jgi:hypothetical protein
MKRLYGTILLATGLAAGGCSRHVLFLEHSHLGLKASFEPNTPTPAEVDLGWRRAIFAMVPQRSKKESKTSGGGSVTVTAPKGGPATVTVVPDPNELMSVYAVFRANVGFADPVCVHHFLATGVAASNLLANEPDLRRVSLGLEQSAAQFPCGGPAKNAGKSPKTGEGGDE